MDSMGKNSERLVPQRSVPRLVHLVASTVASFLGAFAGLVAVLVLLHRFAPAAADAVSITGALLGFLCGGSVGMFCVRAVLGAMDPPAPPDQVAPRAFEAALAELNKPRAGRRTEFWPMLLGSLAIFVALGGLAAGIGRLVLLTAVLGFHEAGHLVAMRAFGYRDARILFIPFLGAVTTGSRENVPGEQRAIVLLAGPVPGLLLGFSLFLLGATHDPVVRQAAGLLIAINAFNLLPLGALDGGKLLDVLLFSRGPLLRAVFAIATSALLGWFAYNRHAWLLLAVAWLGIGAAQNSYKAALAARRLGAREALPQSLEGASPEFLRQLFDLAYLVTPPLLRRSSRGAAANARAMREVHAQAVQRPASLPASALMLSAYVALFALCTVAWSHRHSAPASRHSARAVAAVRNADSR